MKKLLKKILNASEYLVGINQRNLEYVYPNNPRKHFPLANDKVLAKSILEKNGVPVPVTYAVVNELWEISTILEQILIQKEIVIKPANGSGGGGILILFQKDEGVWTTHSGEVYKKNKLYHHLASILYGVYSSGDKDKAIIEYCLTPHPFLTGIYDKGIPDFRIILLKGIPLMAMLRVPTNKSGGKANLHQGAIGIGVDMDRGIVTQGFYKNKYVDYHPDSGNYFAGKVIPDWSKTLEISIETSKLFPLDYLGVDIILDRYSGPMVIEVNARPGLQIQNINKIGLKESVDKNIQL
ncbi:MAG: sugar-transfer associated ATP-grasp domain-containing protein [Bacteroidota bacterium]